MGCSSQGLTRSVQKAWQSLNEGWAGQVHASAGSQSSPLFMDLVIHLKGQPHKQGHLLSQRGGPSSRSHDSLLTLLGTGDPSWALEVICHGYSIEKLQTDPFTTGDQECPTSTFSTRMV